MNNQSKQTQKQKQKQVPPSTEQTSAPSKTPQPAKQLLLGFSDSESEMEYDNQAASADSVKCSESEDPRSILSHDSSKRRKRKAGDAIESYPVFNTDDLTRQAVGIKEELTDYCLDSESLISQDQARYLLKHISVLTDIVRKISMENCRLLGRLEERGNSSGNVPGTSYADKVRSSTQKVPALSKVNRPIKSTQQVVIIRPSEAMKCKSSDDTKKEVMKFIDPKRDKIHVKNLRKIRDNGILIETESKYDLAKIATSADLKKHGFKIERPGKKEPRILIYDVQSSLTEQEIKDAIFEQNPDLVEGMEKSTFDTELKLQFRVGKRREDLTNWVAEVTPALRNKIRKIGRIYIEWQFCRIQDFIGLSRCYQCQVYGHVAKYCRQETSSCGHCAEDGHRASDCPKKAEPAKCASCKRFKKPTNHSVLDKNCPAYKFALEKLVNKIDYGV